MVSEQTFDIMLEHLCKNPEDWVLRLMMADWCEENGLPDRAECLRWMAENHKRARLFNDNREWFNLGLLDERRRLADPSSDIPNELFCGLRDGTFRPGDKERLIYEGVRSSELAVYGAWVRAKQKGWRPEDE